MKKITNFVLPEHTNELYTKEAISSISLTHDIAKKINELVNAYNSVNGDLLVWKHEQEGTIRKGVLFMKDNLINSLRELFDVLEGSDAFISMYGEKLGECYELLNNLNVEITPKMFGAIGDGITDDTKPLLEMLEFVEKNVLYRAFNNEDKCKNYSNINLKFSGTYKISKPIVFRDTYGLTLENLHLIASPIFIGDCMLKLEHITRNFRGVNITLNGSHVVDTCLYINDYTLTFDMVNVEISQFKKYGIYADGKGHELKLCNVTVKQFEWGDRLNVAINEHGTGVYLGEERHDNNIVNLITNYCTKYGVEIHGGTNKIINSHFYSCEVLNKGRYNTFVNCYFDNATLKTYGFFTLNNSLLLRSGENTTPFIYLLGDDITHSWMFDTCNLNSNTFKAETYIDKPVDFGKFAETPKFNTIGNTFYYVTPFTLHARLGHTRNPWDEERESYGHAGSGYKIYGNLAFVWGVATENGFCKYPNGLELKETLYMGFERKDNSNPNLIPWANSISPTQFWLNSVGNGSTVKWFVVGIVK